MKKLWKSVKIWQSYGREYVAYFFWPTLYCDNLPTNYTCPHFQILHFQSISPYNQQQTFGHKEDNFNISQSVKVYQALLIYQY